MGNGYNTPDAVPRRSSNFPENQKKRAAALLVGRELLSASLKSIGKGSAKSPWDIEKGGTRGRWWWWEPARLLILIESAPS